MDSTLQDRFEAALAEGTLEDLVCELELEGMSREAIRVACAEVLFKRAQWGESSIEREMWETLARDLSIIETYWNESSPEAHAALTELHQRNQERAAMVLRQRNSLAEIVVDTTERIKRLGCQIEEARRADDIDTAATLERKKRQYEVALRTTKESLEQAEETAIAVQTALEREQETLRRKGVPLPGLPDL